MSWLIDAAPWIGGIAAIFVVGASLLVAMGDKEQAQEAADRDQRIIDLQGEVARKQDEIIDLQAELRAESDKSVAYLRGDDSYAYLAYRNLNRPNQNVSLIQVGPNPVWDISVQAYPLTKFPTRNELSMAELAETYIRYEDDALHPGMLSALVQFPTPDPDDPTTWAHYVQVFTRAGTSIEILLLDHSDGEWTQAYVVMQGRRDGPVTVRTVVFEERFPPSRIVALQNLIDDIVANAAQASGLQDASPPQQESR